MRLGEISIDLNSQCVYKGRAKLALTHKEYELLILFIKHPNEVLSREEILKDVWGFTFLGQSRTIDMHIRRLRQKLEFSDRIKTHYREGYRLVC